MALLNGIAKRHGLTRKDFDKKALGRGTIHELEHTSDWKTAEAIAMDHLAEDPHYYEKVAKMEKRGCGCKHATKLHPRSRRDPGEDNLGKPPDQTLNEWIRKLEVFGKIYGMDRLSEPQRRAVETLQRERRAKEQRRVLDHQMRRLVHKRALARKDPHGYSPRRGSPIAWLQNDTDYTDASVRAFFEAGLRAHGLRDVELRVVPTPNRSRGCAKMGMGQVVMALAPPSKMSEAKLARLFEHEILHMLGKDHEEMSERDYWSRGKAPEWARGLVLRRKR